MTHDRRTFLEASLAAGALLGTGACSSPAESPSPSASPPPPPAKKRLLVLGGTGFLGPALVEAALARGHEVTLFNRGKTNTHLFPELEKLVGDRDPDKGEGLRALAGRRFDVVFDDCGYFPRMVKASAELLAPNVGQYVYVSSISCYAASTAEGLDETAPLATMEDPTLETMGKDYEHYGALKALCEQAAEAALPGRTTVIRPGYIVGPGDFSGRFTYWPVRIDRGGRVAVPGAREDPIQIIDVRDLGAWMVHVGERSTYGRFNACGTGRAGGWGALIDACVRVSSADEIDLCWIPAAKLAELGQEERFQQLAFPIWAPHAGETRGFHTWSNARAVRAGLSFRSDEVIARDTLAWWRTVAEGERAKRLAGPPAELEAELLAAIA